MSVSVHRLPFWSIAAPILAGALCVALQGEPGLVAVAALVVALVAAVLAAVHHAEVLALRLGEPYGAVLLTLAVTVIELGLLVSIMLGKQPEPTLVRDTIHATVILVLHGIAGLCIVLGGLRYREQGFRTEGVHAYLIVLLPMVAITLVLPNFTTTAPGPYYSTEQLAFVSLACLLLWLAFTFVQTVRHREYFLPLNVQSDHPEQRPGRRIALQSMVLLTIALVSVVLLAKAVSPALQSAVSALGAPAALVGVVVAAIVLLPEGLTAIRAARQDQLQTSINLALGSGVASIGLAIPSVSLIAWWTETPLALGVSQVGRSCSRCPS